MSNSFKAGLAAGKQQIGLWLNLASPLVADATSRLGYDWLLCDTEHAPLEVSGALAILQAADQRTHVVVRAAWNDKVLIKRHLDQGATTMLIPFVENPTEAQEAVLATRYPPHGIRGVAGATRSGSYGLQPGYLQSANDGICLLVQVETGAALDQLEDIASVDGVDGVFIGPSDLAASLGYLGDPGNPVVQDAIKSGLARLKKIGVPAGILAVTEQDAKRYVDWGFDFVAVGIDQSLLLNAAKARLAAIRG